MRGSMTEAVPYMEQAFAVALAAGRKDLQTIASQALAQAHIVRLELDKAERLIQKAVELADESGSPRARGQALLTLGLLHRMRKEYEAAEGAYELARELFAEIGNATLLSYSLSRMADVAFEKGELKRAEKLMRESIRLLAPLGQHRELAEAQAELGRVLAEQGKIDEAERFVAEAQEYLPSAEPQLRLFILLAEAAVRVAQEQQEEAEALLVEALAISDEIDFKAIQAEVLRADHPLPRGLGPERKGGALRGASRRARAGRKHRRDRLIRLLVRRLADHGCRPVEAIERLA